jgi:hypothetical protein
MDYIDYPGTDNNSDDEYMDIVDHGPIGDELKEYFELEITLGG